jgi:predicted NAD/FAD-dependent oxidoreductase
MQNEICAVGAGIAGLVAAARLAKEGYSVIVLDKGRGVGGRMNVRRFSAGTFDHGAQFFSIKDPRFASMVSEWIELGLVTEWSQGFSSFDGTQINPDQTYYRSLSGMNAVAKHLAAGLNIHRQTRVTRVSLVDEAWTICAEDRRFEARALIMTPPVPQTLEILEHSHVELLEDDRRILNGIAYDPCIAMMVVLSGQSNVPEPGGLFGSGEPIQWIADNTTKGISSGAPHVTIHAGPAFSREHWHSDDETVKNLLVSAAQPWLGSDIKAYQVHRWRYSKPIATLSESCYSLDIARPLILAGDAFGGPRVEGAALSGLAGAETLFADASLAPSNRSRNVKQT